MFRLLLLTLLTLSLTTPPTWAAGTPGSTTAEPPPEGDSATAEALARYQAGIRAKELARQEEALAGKATDADIRAGHLSRAQEHYRAAVDAQGSALKIDPQYAEAANELGYALRRTGAFRKAIGAYNYALLLRPDFYEAIEYRGEAFLGVRDFEGAKSAYLKLFRESPGLGTTLLDAMQSWIDEQSESAVEVTQFDAWVTERRELESVTREVSQIEPRSW